MRYTAPCLTCWVRLGVDVEHIRDNLGTQVVARWLGMLLLKSELSQVYCRISVHTWAIM